MQSGLKQSCGLVVSALNKHVGACSARGIFVIILPQGISSFNIALGFKIAANYRGLQHKFNSASVLHILIEHANDVSKLTAR